VKRDGEAIDAAEMEGIARVKAIHRSTGGGYGSRRMAKALQAEGFGLGLELTRFGGYLILCVQGGIHNATITSPLST